MHRKLVGVGDDGLEVAEDLTLCENRSILLVQDIEPVCYAARRASARQGRQHDVIERHTELPSAQDDYVARL